MMQNKRYNKTKPISTRKQKTIYFLQKERRVTKIQAKGYSKAGKTYPTKPYLQSMPKHKMDTKRNISKKPCEKHSEKYLYMQEISPKRAKNKKVYKKIIGMM